MMEVCMLYSYYACEIIYALWGKLTGDVYMHDGLGEFIPSQQNGLLPLPNNAILCLCLHTVSGSAREGGEGGAIRGCTGGSEGQEVGLQSLLPPASAPGEQPQLEASE